MGTGQIEDPDARKSTAARQSRVVAPLAIVLRTCVRQEIIYLYIISDSSPIFVTFGLPYCR